MQLRRSVRTYVGSSLVLGGAFFGAFACADGDSAADADFSMGGGDGSSSSGGTSGGVGGPLPPEFELEESFRAPVVTGAFVWSANPESGRVARIDARTNDIAVYDAGNAPTFLAALPAGKTEGAALVINTASHDASIFFLTGKDAATSSSPGIERRTVPLQDGASAWAVGATGSVAIAWSRASDALLDMDDGYQDVCVLGFSEDPDEIERTVLSVGFRPNRVFVAADETRAFIVSEDGISVLDLSSSPPGVARSLFLPQPSPGLGRDVSFTPNGEFAFVRLEGEAEVLIVDTATGTETSMQFPLPVTDLDLAKSGETGIAVMRTDVAVAPDGWGGQGGAPAAGESVVALFQVAAVLADPGQFSLSTVADTVGSAELSADGLLATLYTTATANPRLTILETASGDLRQVLVRAPILATLLTPDGDHAIALLKSQPTSSKAGGFAAVPLRDELPARIEGTTAAPVFVSLTNEAALVATDDPIGTASTAYVVQFPELRVDALPLPSRPLASGVVVGAGKGFVSQEHPEGRISFIELSTATQRTVTGFELANKVVDE